MATGLPGRCRMARRDDRGSRLRLAADRAEAGEDRTARPAAATPGADGGERRGEAGHYPSPAVLLADSRVRPVFHFPVVKAACDTGCDNFAQPEVE